MHDFAASHAHLRLVFFGLVAFLLAGTVFGMKLRQLQIRRLREVHPDAWQRLGGPAVLANKSLETGTAMLGFIWRFGDRKLADARLTFLCRTERILSLIYISAGIAFALYLVVLHARAA